MRCKDVRQRISDIVWEENGTLNEVLSLHLSECKECSVFYHKYLKATKSLKVEIRNSSPRSLIEAKILETINREPEEISTYSKDHSSFILRPMIKIIWSVSVAAASVLMGIVLGNLIANDTNFQSEKESYFQEISMNSSDLSGINDNFLVYFDLEQKDANGE